MSRHSFMCTCSSGSSSASSYTSSSPSHSRSTWAVPLSAVYAKLRREGERLHRQGGGSKKKSAGLGLWLAPKTLPASTNCPAGVVVLLYFKGKQWSNTGVHVSHSPCPQLRQSVRENYELRMPPLANSMPGEAAGSCDNTSTALALASSPQSSPVPPLSASEPATVPAPPACSCSAHSALPLLVLTVEEAFFFLAGKHPHAAGSPLVIFDAQTAQQLNAVDLLLVLVQRLPPPISQQSNSVQHFRQGAKTAGNDEIGGCDRQIHLGGKVVAKRGRHSPPQTPGYIPSGEQATVVPTPHRRTPKWRGAQDECTDQTGDNVERIPAGEERLIGEQRNIKLEDGSTFTSCEEAEMPSPGVAAQLRLTYQELQVYLQLKSLGLPIRNSHSSELAAAVRLCPIEVSSRFLSPLFPDPRYSVGISHSPAPISHGSFSGNEGGKPSQREEGRMKRASDLAFRTVYEEPCQRSPWVLLLERRQSLTKEFDKSPGAARAPHPPSRHLGFCLAMEEEDSSFSEAGSPAGGTGDDSCSDELTDSDCGSPGEMVVVSEVGESPTPLTGQNKRRDRQGSEGRTGIRQEAGDTTDGTGRLPVFPVSPEATAVPVLLSHFGSMSPSEATQSRALSVKRSRMCTREENDDGGTNDYVASFMTPTCGDDARETDPTKRNVESSERETSLRSTGMQNSYDPKRVQLKEWSSVENREAGSPDCVSQKGTEEGKDLPDGDPHRDNELCKKASKTKTCVSGRESYQKELISTAILVAPTSVDGGVTFLMAQQMAVL
ncbi:conserved hypothetical protein [Neospora caninum Liverpool]|uniref:Uncharacterized protein n=1 Tax=Neospora caninum (strain Liverpool) TaxID=572307 RepID=F0VB49_NEOCL|nr:conserved hypothetical protein [Neospora caninum Liverpool]CBZ51386.1 conserved hypothetical protein [Neospora caninum Liverpool]CEL68706.1 TPA: hypothetical protein BN1204_044480 [Neospora caninum Liverpool]|eukprot:XP_003881419.1 conserved hypothetical protein [Neospora caninum Liverpool]